LPFWKFNKRRIPKNLQTIFPIWWPNEVCWLCVQCVWYKQEWNYWFQRIYLCSIGNFKRKSWRETYMGISIVWSW